MSLVQFDDSLIADSALIAQVDSIIGSAECESATAEGSVRSSPNSGPSCFLGTVVSDGHSSKNVYGSDWSSKESAGASRCPWDPATIKPAIPAEHEVYALDALMSAGGDRSMSSRVALSLQSEIPDARDPQYWAYDPYCQWGQPVTTDSDSVRTSATRATSGSQWTSIMAGASGYSTGSCQVSGPYQGHRFVDSSRTTVMLRNIPNKFTQRMMLDVINGGGFEGQYDFFYLPIDFRNRCNVGYCFLNLVNGDVATKFKAAYDGVKLGAAASSKVCAVSWARIQGLNANVTHYRNSPVNGVPCPQYKPLLFVNGFEVAFPEPTIALSPIVLRPPAPM